ncbi:hypothetical protein [Synechococcus sp. CBW1107]|uniref:hypothetical protein n=1 Tax=Synechococcus sp. CBW1107 TaxID=2789857 RepID=UPI002AD39B97|nr:hypothetical protein [Synechococcus sp. CBW1107]
MIAAAAAKFSDGPNPSAADVPADVKIASPGLAFDKKSARFPFDLTVDVAFPSIAACVAWPRHKLSGFSGLGTSFWLGKPSFIIPKSLGQAWLMHV